MERSSGAALTLGVTGRADRAYFARLIALFCAGWAVIYADRTALYPLLTVIGREFHLSGVQTGLITAAYFALYVSAQLASGLLAERFGLKRMLVLFSMLSAVGVAGFGLAAVNYLALLGVAALHGACAGAYYTMAYSITIHAVPNRLRGIASAVINGGMSLGLAAGLALAGPLYQATGSWRIPFLILAVPTFFVAVLYRGVVREVQIPVRRSISLWKMVGDGTFLCMTLAGFCVLYGWWVLLSWAPVFFQTERGVSLTMSGLYTLVIAITAIPSGLVLGHLSDRIGRKRIVLGMLPLSALTLVAVAQVHSKTGMLLALMAYGLVGKLAWDPLGIAWLGDYMSRTRPEAVVGPPLTGLIRDLTGSLIGGFYLAAAIALVGFSLSLVPPDSGRSGATR